MAEKQDERDSAGKDVTVTGSTDAEHDEELDALLNSALNDFDKVPSNKPVDKSGSSNNNESADAKWTEEFIKQAVVQFETLLSQGDDPSDTVQPEQLEANLQSVAEAAFEAISGEAGSDSSEFSAAISQTLKHLSENAENLQSQFPELASMFSGLGMGEGSGSGDLFPFMQQMMQSLLSKDILYPALKDIVDKYPAWLEENRSKLEPAEFERFSMQKTLMDQVCAELEKESESDSQDVKKRRFDTILELMQKMQDCGQPPKDLVGDLGSMMTFDEDGNPCLPSLAPGTTDPSQCSVM